MKIGCTRAIFFDLDGTPLHYTRAYRAILTDAIRTVEGEVRDEWIDTYNETFFDILMDCRPEPYRRAFATVGEDPDAEALVEALRTREVDACQPPKNAEADLARLGEDYKLGVLTNGVQEWQRHKLEAYNLAEYFDAVITSYDANGHKPDPEPFRLAEKRLPADDYAMVGDDDADIEGAQKAEWTAYRYHGQGFGDLPDALTW
ncbi:HAD family hydrolase [Halorubrum sp. LN27]|uniref:HAD family hydrolase n=1 Tax=Halorubrum sp. LN27 TaxID=2801032 RepID=UPI00190E06E0|nr:HAD family hydrolase [Halorubrum sp. LN27]